MRRTVVIGGAVWLATALTAAGQTLESAGGRLRLAPARTAGGATVSSPGGSVPIATPDGFDPHRLTALSGGWLLAGDAEDGAGRSLHLVRHDGAGTTVLPSPPGRTGLIRAQPVPLVERGTLRGLVWLEGDGPRALAVRAAAWSSGEWIPGPWISQPGPGSQLALSAATLSDRSWLVVWSAFDGEDDEIHWSRGDGRQFSPPRRLGSANSVPDILPALVAKGRGALVAWSRFDGNDYRLQLARLVGDQWRPLPWAGGRGSFADGFLRRGRRTYLLFHTVAGESWELAELSAAGRRLRRAVAPDSPRARPAIELDGRLSGARPVFTWPDGSSVQPEWERP